MEQQPDNIQRYCCTGSKGRRIPSYLHPYAGSGSRTLSLRVLVDCRPLNQTILSTIIEDVFAGRPSCAHIGVARYHPPSHSTSGSVLFVGRATDSTNHGIPVATAYIYIYGASAESRPLLLLLNEAAGDSHCSEYVIRAALIYVRLASDRSALAASKDRLENLPIESQQLHE